jgi:beta-glucosidase
MPNLGVDVFAMDAQTRKSYRTVTEIFDWGAAVTKVIVDLGETAHQDSVSTNTFKVHVVRSENRPDTILLGDAQGDRKVTKAYVSDKDGNAVASGNYAALEMEVGPEIALSSPLNYSLNTNLNGWINCDYTITQQKDIAASSGTISGLVANVFAGGTKKLVDDFTIGKATYDNITLTYASYAPEKDNGKHPLIIWLHGMGEGGTDGLLPICGNKADNFASKDMQTYFGGAYVLAPQTPTRWMDGFTGIGDGTSIYEKALMALIKDYVASNKDIDTNRIYIGGDSNGGYMTMLMARDYTEYFAAAFPACEALKDTLITNEDIQKLKNLPLWFIAAKTDTVVPPADYVTPTYNRLVQAGSQNVHFSFFDKVVDTTGLYKKADGTPYEYMGHWSWIYVYNNQCTATINGKAITIMEWMAAQSDIKLTDEASIDQVISAMTLQEKASLVVGTGWPPVVSVQGAVGATVAIPRLGIPQLNVTDGPVGLRLSDITNMNSSNQALSQRSTAFPISSLLSATWDVNQVKKVAEAIGAEAKAYGIDILLGPALNIQRDPLNGRDFEYFSEDPYLSGKLSEAYVNGVQSNGVGATLKHYAANNQETNRTTVNEVISERALREIYLPGFEMAVKQAHPWAVMSSYPSVNGSFVTQNKYLLTDILRNEWGFDDLVMSDWFAVKDPAAAMQAGNDLIMPGDYIQTGVKEDQKIASTIVAAVENGQLSEEILNRNIRNILKVIIKTLVFNGNQPTNNPDFVTHAKIAREAAAGGMVLLKNSGNVLPLLGVTSIAAIGKNVHNFILGGGGSSDVPKFNPVSLLDGLKNAGYTIIDTKDGNNLEEGMSEQVARYIAQNTDIALVSIGRGSSEGADKFSMDVHPEETNLIQTISKAFHAKGKKVVVLLNIGAPIEIASWNKYVDAILLTWQPGLEAGNALADVLSGKINPSGKLPETFPKKYSDVPSYGNFPGSNGTVYYGEGLYVGYRYYDTREIVPMYEFGYGLSYTRFKYSNLKLNADEIDLDKDESLTVRVDVCNVGKVTGKEVVQLYIKDEASRLDRPYQELKGFKKISLQPRETKTVTFRVNKRALSAYDDALKSWVAEAGRFKVRVASSSRDIRLEQEFKAVGNAAYAINLNTPWLAVQTYGKAATIVAKYISDDVVNELFSGNPTLEDKLKSYYNSVADLKDNVTKQKEITDKILAELAQL